MSSRSLALDHIDRVIASIGGSLSLSDTGLQPLIGALLADCLDAADKVRDDILRRVETEDEAL